MSTAAGSQHQQRRVSLGVVDSSFLTAYQKGGPSGPKKSGPGSAHNAGNEVSLSQARSKALARLGASEDAGGPAQAFATGRNGRRRRREPLLPPKFNDPEVEEEYQLTAYLMHRSFLVWLLLLFGLAWGMIALSTLLYDLRENSNVSAAAASAAAVLRGAASALALVDAVLVLGSRLSLRSAQMLTSMALVLLWAAPLGAAAIRSEVHECPELLLLLVGTYGVLCPAFHIRLVAAVMLTMCALHVVLLVTPLFYEDAVRPIVFNVLLRELLKSVRPHAARVLLCPLPACAALYLHISTLPRATCRPSPTIATTPCCAACRWS